MRDDEIRDLIISTIILAFVFSYEGINNFDRLLLSFPVALFVIATAFVFHELAHRFVARRNGCYAVYKAWPQGLLFALLITIFTNGTFVFAAPGAVVIYPIIDLWGRRRHITSDIESKIALAGPVTNLILSFIFLLSSFILLPEIFAYAARINAWLCVFNLLPIEPLDGSKIFLHKRNLWIITMILATILFIITSFVS
jgi:Zn-dependent protease